MEDAICQERVKERVLENYLLYFSSKTYVVGTQENRLNETCSFEHPKHTIELMKKEINRNFTLHKFA